MTSSNTPPHSQAHDRATVVANTIMVIIQTHLRQSKAAHLGALSTADRAVLHTEVTGILRDEFHDQRRQDHAETKPSD